MLFYFQRRSSFQVIIATDIQRETYLITSYDDLNFGAALVKTFFTNFLSLCFHRVIYRYLVAPFIQIKLHYFSMPYTIP